MSDISIPGVNSRFNTDKTIDGLVKLETIPLDRLKADQKTLQTNKTEWQDVNRLMSTLRASARSMYNFESPFLDRTATSSDPAITASATRLASEGTTRIQVVQLAGADRFASKALPKDYSIPDGTYTFQLGTDTLSLRYHGGNVQDFADALNRRADGRIKASVIQNTTDSRVLLIESQKTGAAWPLTLKDDAVKLGLDLGMIEPQLGASADIPVDPAHLAAWTKPVADQKDLVISDGKVLSLGPGAELSLPLPAGFALNPNMILEYKVRATSLGANQLNKAPAAPPGPNLSPGPGATFKDVTLPDLQSQVTLPAYTPPPVPPTVIDNKVLFAAQNGATSLLAEVQDSADFQTVQVPVGKNFPGFSALDIRNSNTGRKIEISDIRVFDPSSRGQYKPSNPISTAQDSKIKIDGVEITRDSNNISDAIPGVSLALNDVTDKPISVKVEPDRKQVKDKIIEFVAGYNAVVREINIVTARSDNTDVVNEIDFLDDKSKQDAIGRLGMMQGETTLNMIKNRLQTIMAGAYPSVDGASMAVLSQAGISTNAAQGGSNGVNVSKLRGYLEIDEKALDKALQDHFLAIKDLFGKDTNGDLLPDSGAGVQLDSYIQPFIQIGGILASKTSLLDTQISSKNTDIKNYEAHLQDYQAQLKDKYAKMEGTVDQLQQSIQGIQALNNNSNK